MKWGSEGKLLAQGLTQRVGRSGIITEVPKSSVKHFLALCTKNNRVKCVNAFNYARIREKWPGLEGPGPQDPYLESEDHSLMVTHSLGPYLR